MSNADIVKAGSSLQKNLDNHNYESALDILKQLRDELAATDAILKETKIGLAVGKLRKHENRRIVEISNEIVRKWKQEIDAAKAKNGAGKSTARVEKASAAPISTTKPAEPKVNTPRTADTDKANTAKTDESVRNNCIKLIYNGLAIDADTAVSSALLLEKSVAIEEIIHQRFKTLDGPYKQKMRSLFLNLKGTNISLRREVVSGKLTPDAFCAMTPEEMASDERKAENKKLEEEGIFAARAATNTNASTDMFKCGKCKQNKTTYYQMQTRSADEPMTTFVTCQVSLLRMPQILVSG